MDITKSKKNSSLPDQNSLPARKTPAAFAEYYRKLNNESQKDAARHLKISTTAYHHKEHGKTPFSDFEIKILVGKWVNSYNQLITADEFLFGPQGRRKAA